MPAYRGPMELGVCIHSNISEIDHVVLAEELGFTHAWMADSQMIWSDCYAVMALAADRTSRIRIGTGVAVAGPRNSAVIAAAHATINQIAPGRVFCGIGTGNTAMRIMGHKPMRFAEFDQFLGELRSLLDGEETEVEWRGQRAITQHLMPDHGFVAFQPRMPLYVSAFGPKALAAAARHGDGLIASLPPVPEAVEHTWSRLQASAADAGRSITPADFPMSTLTTMVVLEPGERRDSPRVFEEAGAFAAASLHYMYEGSRQLGKRPPAYAADLIAEYAKAVEETPAERRHLRIHRGHNCWVDPEDEPFITQELIEATCMIGTAEELATTLRELDDAGLSQVVLLPNLAPKAKVLRDVATRVMPLLA